jgi:hypothetical protein
VRTIRAAISPNFGLLPMILLFVALVCSAGTAFGIEPPVMTSEPATAPGASAGSNEPPVKRTAGADFRHLSSKEITLSALVLIFGTITLLFEFTLMRGKEFAPDEILKVLSLTLIIVGALFIITAGFGSDQIAPAMGLFGTIAGYLLAKRDNPARPGPGASE